MNSKIKWMDLNYVKEWSSMIKFPYMTLTFSEPSFKQ